MATLSSTHAQLSALPSAFALFKSELTPAEQSVAGANKAGMIRSMADFAKAAYNLNHPGAAEYASINDLSPHAAQAHNELVNHHWTPVSFASLPPVIDQGMIQTGMLNDGFFINGNAAAYIARCGDAIVLAFRGTNDNGKDGVINPADLSNSIHPDVDQWGNMPDYYSLLAPVIIAFDTYVANHPEIDKVYVTGHSMGGTMALEYMSGHVGSQYHAMTFGASPFGQPEFLDFLNLTERKNYAPDDRVTQIEIAQDPVPLAFDIENILGETNSRPGHVINIGGNQTLDAPDLEKVPYVSDYYARDANHSMDYYRQITDSVDADSWTKVLSGAQTQTVLLAGRQVTDTANFVVDGRVSGTNTTVENGNNNLTSVSFNTLYGGKGNDSLKAGAMDSLLLGGVGQDLVIGQVGNDILIGGTGQDKLLGGLGDDRLVGGLGKDMLRGGLGADSFKFNSLTETGIKVTTRDVIGDFKHGEGDKIDLSVIDADSVAAGNNAFTAPTVGGVFSGIFAGRGDLYFDQVNHLLYGNNDTDAAADFSILLSGIISLSATDFIL